jgi:hypothetical protein
LSVYPNPSSDKIEVKFNMPADAKNISFVIFDVLGNKVSETSLNGNAGTATIRVSEFNNGMYIYSMQSENAGILNTGRFIIAK